MQYELALFVLQMKLPLISAIISSGSQRLPMPDRMTNWVSRFIPNSRIFVS